jgi:hypothetical protein
MFDFLFWRNQKQEVKVIQEKEEIKEKEEKEEKEEKKEKEEIKYKYLGLKIRKDYTLLYLQYRKFIYPYLEFDIIQYDPDFIEDVPYVASTLLSELLNIPRGQIVVKNNIFKLFYRYCIQNYLIDNKYYIIPNIPMIKALKVGIDIYLCDYYDYVEAHLKQL